MFKEHKDSLAQKLVRWAEYLALGGSVLLFLLALSVVVADWSSGPQPFTQANFNGAIALVLVVASFCIMSAILALFGIIMLFIARKLQQWKFSRPQLLRLWTGVSLVVLNIVLTSLLQMPRT